MMEKEKKVRIYSITLKFNFLEFVPSKDKKAGILEQIAQFLIENPKEVIFLELVHEWNQTLTVEQKAWVIRRVY